MILTKGNDKKILDDNSKLIPVLREQGWLVEGEEAVEKTDELDREALKAEANALGIEYPKNIKNEKLKELIEATKE